MIHPLMNNNISIDELKKLSDFILTNPRLTCGEKVIEFEQRWSEWLGTNYTIMVNNGSSANFATMLALKNTTKKKKVILSPLTWVSDINSVLWAGFEPEFLDISPTTLSINSDLLKKLNSEDIACVFLTHVLGLNGINNDILDYCKKNKIPLIEDCCESHGATFKGQKVGSFGLASNFSCYYAHHLTTIEGGMISTNDEKFYDLCKMIRGHGMLRESHRHEYQEKVIKSNSGLNKDFIFPIQGFNFRPTEINGFLGIEQIKKLDKDNQKRNENFDYFLSKLNSKYYKDFNTEGMSNYALLVLLKDKDPEYMRKVCSNLESNQVEFRRGLSGGGNQLRQPYLKDYVKYDLNNFQVTEWVHQFSMYIGNFPTLEREVINHTLKALNI